TRSSVRFSIRCTAPPTWLKSFWFAAACALSPSIAEAVAARFFCASATKLRDAAFKLSPLRLCANSPSVLAISFCLPSILAILANTSLEGDEVDAGAVIRSSRRVVSSSMTFTNPASFFCCSASRSSLAFCASTAVRIEVNASIVSGLPSGCGDCTGPFCCFSLSSAALMFLLLLLLVVVEERLRALRGEVRRESARAFAALGTPGLAAAVLDVERPGLLTGALAPLADGGVQTHPRHPLPVTDELLVLLLDHRFETGLVHRPGIGQGGAHPVAHLAVETALGEVFAAQLPVLRRVLQPLHDRETVLQHQRVVRRLHAPLIPRLTVVKRPVVGQCFTCRIVVVDHEDVVMRLTAATIGVRYHETIRVRVHLLCELIPEIVHPLHVLGVLR